MMSVSVEVEVADLADAVSALTAAVADVADLDDGDDSEAPSVEHVFLIRNQFFFDSLGCSKILSHF